ncbi:MAG: sugar phosphate isomerase/epimerase [Clostridia bacterium]|nr:sugar phosphate isomerase/epimerase [Clostridia bacterium]
MKLVTNNGPLISKRGYDFIKATEIIKNAGFDAYDHSMCIGEDEVELFLSDEYQNKIKHLKEHADKIGLPCLQAHAPFGNIEVLLPAIIRSIEYAAYLGADIIVVHPYTDNWNYYENKDKLFEENMKYYRSLISYAKEFGIKIAVENMFGWDRNTHIHLENTCSHSEEFVKYVDTLDSEYITACVDTGHSHLMYEKPEHIIKKLGSRVGALHIHDNTALDDAHQIPYFGTINWDNVCKALAEIDYKGHFTFESNTFINKYMDDDFIPTAYKYLEQVGRSLIKKIESHR